MIVAPLNCVFGKVNCTACFVASSKSVTTVCGFKVSYSASVFYLGRFIFVLSLF